MDGYKHIDEISLNEIVYAAEFDGYYYLKLKPETYCDNSMWKVDKNTGEATYIDYTAFIIDISKHATELDPKTFKRVS